MSIFGENQPLYFFVFILNLLYPVIQSIHFMLILHPCVIVIHQWKISIIWQGLSCWQQRACSKPRSTTKQTLVLPHAWWLWLMTCSLTHWSQVTHICVSELSIIGSDNGLSPGRRQAIIWNNAVLLLIEPLGTNFSEISIGIQTFSFNKMHLNMSSVKWCPFCLSLNVLITTHAVYCRLHVTW